MHWKKLASDPNWLCAFDDKHLVGIMANHQTA